MWLFGIPASAGAFLPLDGEGEDGEDGGVGDGLHGEHLGVARELAEDPRVLPPQLVHLERQRCNKPAN